MSVSSSYNSGVVTRGGAQTRRPRSRSVTDLPPPVSRQAFPSSGYTVLRTNATASLQYVLPKRTSYVEVWGSTGWGFANYTVTLTPSPPFNPPVITYSANTAYYVPAYILSWAILDPNVDYVLEFKSSGGWSEVYNVQYFLAK